MQNHIKAADFVLLVCTETYLRRYDGDETVGGKGVTFEGVVISQTLYDAYYHNTKFVPILPEGGDFEHVPLPLKQYGAYTLSVEYDDLYRYLSGQPKHVAPPVGGRREMLPAKSQIPSVSPFSKGSALQSEQGLTGGSCSFNVVHGEQEGLKPSTAPLDEKRGQKTSPLPPNKIQITKLPHTNSHLFGRETELTMLDNAWAGGVNVLILKAMGGTGKTSLLKHWLDQFVADGYRGAQAVFTWSFYSQGSAESKQVSTDDFFEAALRFFGYTEAELPAPHDRGIQLAYLVAAQRALLILDGLEPLQHPVGTLRGELKDQGLKALLQQLVVSNAGLCLISSRQTVEELKGKAETLVLAHDLEHLQVKDGVELLQSIGVSGPEAELEQAVSEVAGHALALNLLGNYVKTVLQGDIRQRDKIPGLMAERHDGQHAQKMLAAYETHLHGSTALSILYLMGLFDRPVSPGAIQCLQQAKIPGLTDTLGSEADWCYAIVDLREQKLLNAINPDYPENLDCHPLIREYFAQQLQNQHPEAWQQAHACLYAYYKDLPEKELPDTLEEMQPLFSAVAHGCAAGLYQEALEEVFWPRIRREVEGFLVHKLGGFNDDLAAVAHFFTTLWQTPAAGLTDAGKAALLNWAGFGLCGLGRLHEAEEPIQISINRHAGQGDWEGAAINSSNLSELQLTLGKITKAISSAAKSLEYADKSGDIFQQMSGRATYADALHQAGKFAQANELFKIAETLQQERQPHYPRLYSHSGFRYCDFLLTQLQEDKNEHQLTVIVSRAAESINWEEQMHGAPILDFALHQLTIGWSHLQLALSMPSCSFTTAERWLEKSVTDLRAAGSQHHLPRGLLARAALFRHTQNFISAQQDLQEVFEISITGGMRLFLVDYHLEMGRLLLAKAGRKIPFASLFAKWIRKGFKAQTELTISEQLQHHITEADRLITETGYHRRDQELLDLKKAAAKI